MNNFEDKNRYDYMLNMPYIKSKIYNHMSMTERAAQFGSFRPLNGYEEAIIETGRLTTKKTELDEYQKIEIDYKIRYLNEHISDMPQITVKYFVRDDKKEGGEYLAYSGILEKIDYYEKKIIFADGKEICVSEIISIVSSQFDEIDF